MSETILSKCVISQPVVRTNGTVRFGNPLYKWRQAGAGSVLQVSQTNTPNAIFSFIFHCNTNECFSFSATATFAWLLSTDISLVDFDQTTQLVSTGPHHRTTKFLQPLPSSMIATEVKSSLQPESICSVFLASDVPHSMKPKPQRFASTMKNSSGGNRSLPSTLNAMEKPSIRSPSALFSAMRTNKALRPSQCSQVFDTSGLSAKPILKFKQVLWVIFLHEEAYYILWSLESSAYPSSTK